jgi:hypothetical protein
MNLAWRKGYLAAFTAVVVLNLLVPRVRAAIIASDNLDSYTAGSAISTAAELNGGTGWAGAWAASSTTTNITRTIENPVFTSLDNAVMVTITSNQNVVNALSRQIYTPQTGTFYVGMLMRTSVANPTTNDFLHFYFNSTAGSSDTAGYGGGINRGGTAGVAGSYFVRRGNNASPGSSAGQTASSSILHNYGQDTILIFEFAKSLDGESNPYDMVSLYVNQISEGTPNAALSGTNGSGNANLSSIDTFHIRYSGSNASGTQVATLAFDDLVFADSYEEAYTFATTGIPEPHVTIVMGVLIAGTGSIRRPRRVSLPPKWGAK